MRVTHVACVAPPEIGGIGQAAWSEVMGLRARGVDARLLAPGSPSATDDPAITRVAPMMRVGNASVLPGSSSLLRDTDVIHLHYPFYGTAERLLWHRSRPPIVMTFHMDADAPGCKGLLFRLHRAWMQPSLLAHADRILVSSLDYARHSSLAPFLERHPNRVMELPFAVDTNFFSPSNVLRSEFRVPSPTLRAPRPSLLFVGGLDQAHAFKGLSHLLEALSHLSTDVELTVVGDGDLRASYEREAERLGLRARVHFSGRLDREALREAYRAADFLVLPSVSRAEAFGIVLIEAQACGLPVIASDLPGVRTVVRAGETGWLVSPDDPSALLQTLTTVCASSVPATMRPRCRSWVEERFSSAYHLDALIAVYQSVCASR